MTEQILGKVEVNNSGTALRIGKGEIRDNLQQLLNIVRKNIKKKRELETAVAEIKEAMRLLNNL